VKPVGEPDALIGHVRFDERGWETERCRMAQATAPILDSTMTAFAAPHHLGRDWTTTDKREFWPAMVCSLMTEQTVHKLRFFPII
jgi:hypothetical protein